MKKIIIVAPHADDETLGCGGTILRYIREGAAVHWLIITGIAEQYGYTQKQTQTRLKEIEKVTKLYQFTQVHELNFQPAALDSQPQSELINAIAKVINKVKPEEIFTAYRNDAHSDHETVYDAVMSATKSFRYPFIKRVLVYETLSETNFGMKPEDFGFRPNVFINIGDYLEKKMYILETFKSEIGPFPFPRSRIAVEALAKLRGTQCNHLAAEAFMLLKEII